MARCFLMFRELHTLPSVNHSFVTTPIFYVNADPHIGHLYSALLADAAHRWQQMKGVEHAVFSTGTDEHGLKIQKAAASLNCTPLDLCNRISQRFKDLFHTANVQYTHYIRTTDPRHKAQVEWFWRELQKKGHIYKGMYEGWYSVPDEAFLSGLQVRNGFEPGSKVSVESGHLLEWSSEENYLFRLTNFQQQLLEWIDRKPYPITPESAHHQVRQYLLELTSDLSISRPQARLNWGIPVPGDPSQTVYVWLDALVNYLTVSNHPAAGHTWPATAHIVGKDILRFHAVYWPAFLLAAGLELPQKIVTHSHWTMGKTKMSKSKGNVVDPFQQMEKYGVDTMRYFLLKEGTLQQDGDYSEDRVVVLLNSDLADTLGNLLQRVTSKKLHPEEARGVQVSSEIFQDTNLVNSLLQLPDTVDRHYENFEFNKGIAEIMKCLHQANQFLERHKPWLLVKDSHKHIQLQAVLGVAIETLRLSSCLLHPIIPHSTVLILERLGFEGESFTSGVRCKLETSDGMRNLELGTKDMNLGGMPLFRKLYKSNVHIASISSYENYQSNRLCWLVNRKILNFGVI